MGSDHRAIRADLCLGYRLKPHPKTPPAPQRALLRNASVREKFVERVKELKRERTGFKTFPAARCAHGRGKRSAHAQARSQTEGVVWRL